MADMRTILIADGNPRTIPALNDPLRELGFSAIGVSDASYVLTMAIRHKPVAVLLGSHLPAGGALVALRRLRASVHTAPIPVIAVATPGAQKQALLSGGVEECLEPPVSEANIMAAVQRQLGIARPVGEAPTEVLRDTERLSALDATGLLDSEPDEALDVVTRLAADVLGVPVALVSLVDGTRQFFKSQVGLPTPWDARRQTPLSHSFCQWVVSSHEELAVSDARVHPVLRLNRAVSELGVIAYAGVPLSAVTGQPIGSFCAIDGKPRSWTGDELSTVRHFAQLVDAQTALNLRLPQDLASETRDRSLRAITKAAARGFQGAARLLLRKQPLSSGQRHVVGQIIERLGHQLTDVVSDEPTTRGAESDTSGDCLVA